MEKIKGYKGFDKNMKCRGFQYETGKDYQHDGNITCCHSGFHFCTNPFDVLAYYAPANSRFCEVEGSGESAKEENDTKVSVSNLHVGFEIGLNGLINAGVKFILNKVKWNNCEATNTGDRSAVTNTGDLSTATNTGDRSAATNTGYRSAATNTGNYSAATNTGNRSAANVEGKDSIAIVTGRKSKAAGALGCWLVLTERDDNMNIINVKAIKVDGKKIKANIFYTLEDGEIKEEEQQ